MWRYMAGGLAALAMAGAGLVLYTHNGGSAAALPAAPYPLAQAAGGGAVPGDAPEASARRREQKRFNRYDKDRDGAITREEYLAQRRKAYARLDTNHDGVLSFEEWAIKTETRFANADTDKSGAMTPVEFVRTAPQRKAPRIRRDCPPVPGDSAPGAEES